MPRKTQVIRHVVENEISDKSDQARALARVIAPTLRDAPISKIYEQLEALGWFWSGGCWIVRVDSK